LTKDCEVVLMCCRTGRSKNLLTLLSQFLGGRSVKAPIWDQGPGFLSIDGDEVECVSTKCTYTNGLLNFDSDARDGLSSRADRKIQRDNFRKGW